MQDADDNIDQVSIDRLLVSPSIRWAPSEHTELVGRFTYTEIKQLEYAGRPAPCCDAERHCLIGRKDEGKPVL